MNSKNDVTYKVLNPLGEAKNRSLIPLASRISNLDGKVIYCISQFIGGADIFISRVAEILPHTDSGAKAVYKRKPGVYMSNDAALWQEISDNADAVIYGCGA